jgi:hypothetical protein
MRALARERLSSYREPASRNPQDVLTRLIREPCTRTPFRLLSIRAPRQAVLRTSSWLAPSSLPPTGLATSRWRRRTMRPTDVCHPNELRAPAPRAFPAHSRHFRSADTPRSLGLRAVMTGGPNVSRHSRPLRRIVIERKSRALLPHGLESRTWAFSSHGADAIEPLTPLSRPLVDPHASSTFADAASWPQNATVGVALRVGGLRDRQDQRERLLVKADASC